MSQGAQALPRPDTPTSWLVARLCESPELRALLGVPQAERTPVFQSGDVPTEGEQPNVFIVVRPPVNPDARVYGERFPQSLSGQYLIWAETRTDRLPADKGFDDVLGPLVPAIFAAITGEGTAVAPTGGKVWSFNTTGYYTPATLDLTEHIKIAQSGIVATLLAT